MLRPNPPKQNELMLALAGRDPNRPGEKKVGYTEAAIAKLLKVSKYKVNQTLRRSDLQLQPPRDRRDLNKEPPRADLSCWYRWRSARLL